jgi:hypothetical protein
LHVLAQSPAVQASAATQPRLFPDLQLPTLSKPAPATKLPDAARACALRLTRCRRALKNERGCLGRGHALLARLELEVVLECRTWNDGRIFAGPEPMQLVCVSDGDSQPAFRGQDLAIDERREVVRKVANALQCDPAISVLRHCSTKSDFSCSVACEARHRRALTPRHDLARPSARRSAIESIPSVSGCRGRRKGHCNGCRRLLTPMRRTRCGFRALSTFYARQRLVWRWRRSGREEAERDRRR